MKAQNDWAAIKRHYSFWDKRIFGVPRDEWACDPYQWDMGKNMISMTPIEQNFWADCRDADLILYPQYPANGYFIDFANPVAKVAIECDGRAFHMDKERDAKREAVLVRNGWKVYRIEGWQCNQNYNEETKAISFGAELAKVIGSLHGIARRRKPATEPRHVSDISGQMLVRFARGFA